MECVLYGVGSAYVYEVHETVQRLGWTVQGLIANVEGTPIPDSLGPVATPSEIPPAWLDFPTLFPLVTPGYRQHVVREAWSLGFRNFRVAVDPTSVIARSASLDEGVLVNASGVVGANSHLGKFALINRSASLGHDVAVEDYATLGPGCVLSGSVRIGRGVFVGSGAVILPEVTVGANAVVGAGAVVVHDVPANSVVVGNPARITRADHPGYNGVSVDDGTGEPQ
jgi:sugar O-acyltransferase (sialic acid O-acetyltransferase NeuD family)